MEVKLTPELIAYKKQQRQDLIVKILLYMAIFLATALIYMVLAGDRFQESLKYLGLKPLTNAETGLYADCSKIENRLNRFCNKGVKNIDKEWNRVGNAKGSNFIPFNLYD